MPSEPAEKSYSGLSIHETVKTENGNILFDMDAHGKKYIFYFFHSIPAALYPPEFFVAHPAIPVDTLLQYFG